MIKLKMFLNKNYDLIICLLIIILPFSKAIPNLILGLLILIFTINFKKQYLEVFFKSSFFVLLLLVLLLYLQAILNGTFIIDISIYERFLYLIIIPILFLKVENFNLIKNISLITINITILVSTYFIFDFYQIYNFIPMGDGWSINKVLLLERPYSGMFSVISIILSFDLMQKNDRFHFIYLLSLLVSVFFIFFISIRISIIIVFVLIFIYLLFYLKINYLKKIYFFIAIFSTSVLLFSINKNISKRFFISETIQKTIQKINKSEPRVVIWGCAKEITQQKDFSVFFGTISYTNINNSLIRCYESSIEDYSRKNHFLEHKYNTHNQFIDFYLIGGLLAIFIFFIFFIFSIYKNNKNFFSIAIIISFFLFLMIENVFHRQFGCFIFAIFTAIYLINPKTHECQ